MNNIHMFPIGVLMSADGAARETFDDKDDMPT
jgi:hypothetical protein